MKYGAVVYACLGILATVILAAILFPIFAQARGGGGPSCMGNLQNLSRSLLIYNDDYDGLPPSDTWMDSLSGKLNGDRVYHCPQVYRTNRYEYGYAMETKLGGRDVHNIDGPLAKEPMVFDSYPIGRNAHTNHVIIEGFSRHNGQNIAYADGHAAHAKGR